MSASWTITPAANAADSLDRLATALTEVRAGHRLAVKAALQWGWHAIGILAVLRLLPHRDRFDDWVRDYLTETEAALHVERDAGWDERSRIGLLEWVDLFSEETLPSLRPEFYHGWTDRASRCEELRRTVTEISGGSVNADQREALLLLLALYHRLVRQPAAVTVEPEPVRAAWPALLDLVDRLIDRDTPDGERLAAALQDCRAALGVAS